VKQAGRGALERTPEGRDDWKPHEKSMPRGRLAMLVAGMPSWLAMMSHHRGQLTVYLRLNNVPVPAIYGPSADDTRFE
jgi:uncharacterized damage-inducible protein DinB